MNVFFNNKQIIITELDSEKTITNKIGIALGTLPKYLYFPNGFPKSFNENEKYIVEDLLDTIKIYVSTRYDFTELHNDIISKFTLPFSVYEDIITPFIIYNKNFIDNLKSYNSMGGFVDMFISSILDRLYVSLRNLQIPFNEKELLLKLTDYQKYIQVFEKNIQTNLLKESKILNSINEIMDLDGIKHTDFQLEENVIEIKLDIPPIFSILDIFNFIELNTNIQFASCNGFYKIFGDFIAPDHWIINDEDKIVLYILKTKRIKRKIKPEKEGKKKEEENEEEEDEEDEEDEEEEEEEKEKEKEKTKDETKLEQKMKKKLEKEYDSSFVKVVINSDFNVMFDFNINQISKENVMNTFFSIFPEHEVKIISEKCSLIRGIFDFPNKNLNKTVLCDLIMSNDIFSNFITIDESKGIPFSKTTLHFNHESTGEITASIIEQKDDKYKNNDDEDDEYFSKNSYIRIHITKCSNEKNVEKFQYILSRLLEKYYLEFDNIARIYKIYLDDFEDTTKKNKKQKVNTKSLNSKAKDLEKLEPDIFIKGKYIRNICQQYPQNIDKDYENYQEHLSTGKPLSPNNLYKKSLDEKTDILIFPKKEMNGFDPRRYICNVDRNIKLGKTFPGMKENKLKNKQLFKHLPCCFKIRQNTKNKIKHLKKKSPSIFNLFKFENNEDDSEEEKNIEEEEEEGEDEEEEDEDDKKEYIANKKIEDIKNELVKHQQDKIKTNKFVKELCSGMLPPKLNLFFENLQNDINYTFYRFGVKRSPNSFIDCIQTIHLLSERDDSFWLYTEDLRRQLFSKMAILSKQENAESTVKNIQSDIKQVNTYFNPLSYVRILEEYYKYNIFIFVRDDDNNEYLKIPFFKEGYYKKENKNKCVFIYVHKGSESDASEYPQCEIIALSNNKSAHDIQCEFDYDSEISQKVINMFNKLDNVYYIKENDYEKIEKLNIVSQFVDNKGKTRIININYNNILFSMIFKTPFTPLNIDNDERYYSISNERYLEELVLNYLKLTSIKHIVLNDVLSEIHGKFGTLDVIIMCNGISNNLHFAKRIIEKTSLTLNNLIGSRSQIDSFKFNKKLAKYLTEYIFWLYSIYIHQKMNENPIINTENADQNLIEGFVRKFIIIDTSFSYKKMKNIFSLQNSDIMRQEKMIINSNEILKRLLYSLRLEITRNFPSILNYRENTFLKNFYLDTEDFENFPNQVVLKNQEFTLKWLKEKEENTELNKYSLYDFINPNLIQPYFLKNDRISNQIFIAQNTNSFENATQIAMDWTRKKYNSGYYVEPEKDFEYFDCNLFAYQNPSEINNFYVNINNENSHGIKIVGYKINGESYFTTLLKF